jgi:hypothetical protein
VFPFIYFGWTEELRSVESALLQLALKEIGEYYLVVICNIGDFRDLINALKNINEVLKVISVTIRSSLPWNHIADSCIFSLEESSKVGCRP